MTRRRTKLLQERALIKLYKSFPCLWHRNHPDYLNHKVRSETYKKLIQMYREYDDDKTVTLAYMRLKVANWRRVARYQYKRILEYRAQGCLEEYKPKMWYYRYLKFLVEDDYQTISHVHRIIDISDSDSEEEFNKMMDEQQIGSDDLSYSSESDESCISIGSTVQKTDSKETQSNNPKNEVLEQLFTIYKDFPWLWNQKVPLYQNEYICRVAYETLLKKYKELDGSATVSIVKEQIDTYITSFFEEHKQVLASEAKGEKYKSKFMYYDSLIFLVDENKSKISNTSDSTPKLEVEEICISDSDLEEEDLKNNLKTSQNVNNAEHSKSSSSNDPLLLTEVASLKRTHDQMMLKDSNAMPCKFKKKTVFIEIFEAYKNFRWLWDNESPLNRNEEVCNTSFEVLLEKYKKIEPLATLATIREKIDISRAKFNEEHKQVLSSRALGKEYEPILWYYQYLTFIIKEEDERETCNPNKILKTEETPVSDLENINAVAGLMGILNGETNNSSEIKANDQEATAGSSLEHLSKLEVKQSKQKTKNAIIAFGKTLDLQLEELSVEQRFTAEDFIAEIVFQAKSGKLRHDSCIEIIYEENDVQPT